MESSIAQSELPPLTGTDLSGLEAPDLEVIPTPTPSDKGDDRETIDPSVAATTLQTTRGFVPPASFYGNPSEKKEKRNPLCVTRSFS